MSLPSIDIQMNEIERSAEFYRNLDSADKEIIVSYTQEIDADDWVGAGLLLSYQVMNYVFKKKQLIKEEFGYTPELLDEKVLSRDDFEKQVENAKKLKCILDRFPIINNDIDVYRGFYCGDVYSTLADALKKGQEMTIPFFLSTTINPNIAHAFTGAVEKCLWYIHIPKGNRVAYIRDKTTNCGECEVLLNLGAVLQLKNKYIDSSSGAKILEFYFIGYSKSVETRGFWPMVSKVAMEYAACNYNPKKKEDFSNSYNYPPPPPYPYPQPPPYSSSQQYPPPPPLNEGMDFFQLPPSKFGNNDMNVD